MQDNSESYRRLIFTALFAMMALASLTFCRTVAGQEKKEETSSTTLKLSAAPAQSNPLVLFSSNAAMLEIRNDQRETLVKMWSDGRMEYGANYQPDEAAEVFWKAMLAAGIRINCPDLKKEPAR